MLRLSCGHQQSPPNPVPVTYEAPLQPGKPASCFCDSGGPRDLLGLEPHRLAPSVSGLCLQHAFCRLAPGLSVSCSDGWADILLLISRAESQSSNMRQPLWFCKDWALVRKGFLRPPAEQAVDGAWTEPEPCGPAAHSRGQQDHHAES